MQSGFISFRFAIPPKNAQRRSLISPTSNGSLFLLTLPRPGVQIVVLVVGLLGYRHTVTQERDPSVPDMGLN